MSLGAGPSAQSEPQSEPHVPAAAQFSSPTHRRGDLLAGFGVVGGDANASGGASFGGGLGGGVGVGDAGALQPGAAASAMEARFALAGAATGQGPTELPFDSFGDVTKSLNVLMLHAKRSYDEAEDEYRAALRSNESFEWAHNSLGLVLMNVRNDYDGAERSFRRAIELDPTYAWARNNLGLLLFEVRQEWSEAEVEFRRAVELDPHHTEAHCNLATLLNTKAERIEETGADLSAAASIYMEVPRHTPLEHLTPLPAIASSLLSVLGGFFLSACRCFSWRFLKCFCWCPGGGPLGGAPRQAQQL